MVSPPDPAVKELPLFPLHRQDVHPPHVEAALVTAAVLGDRTRALILEILRDGPRCVCEIAAATGEREHDVSVELDRLRATGLVRRSRSRLHDHWTFYERDETACRAALRNLEELLG